MTILQLIKKYRGLEIELLISHVLGKSKEFLYMNPGFGMTALQLSRLYRFIARRKKGEPIAYIIGHKDFLGLSFEVNKNVLIPRPETELMVQDIIKSSLGLKRTVSILDVGTGSGCIIVSAAHALTSQRYSFTASDVSGKALMVAKKNSKKHGTSVTFLKSNLLKNIKADFDIVVANLPYGWSEWKNNSSASTVGLKFEPRNALFTDEHGLKLIRELLEQIAERKNKPKLVYLEFDPRQKRELLQLIKKILPEYKAVFHKDLSGHWRFVRLG